MYSAFVWRADSPGHDELRCVFFLINGTVMKTISGSRLRARRWDLFVRLSYPVQTLVGTLNSRCGAVKWERDSALPSRRPFSAPAQAAIALVGGRYSSPLDRTAQATRASLLAAAVMTTLMGARCSSASSHGPNGDRSRFTRSTADRAPCTRILRR
jgi:hypothetical protein